MSLLLDDEPFDIKLSWQPPRIPLFGSLNSNVGHDLTLAEMEDRRIRQEEMTMYLRTYGTEFL